MKISEEELNKPVIKKKDGGFATLKEVVEGNLIIKDEMDSEDYRDLSIARYEMMDPGKAIAVGGASYTKDRIIEEVKKHTDAGEIFIGMQVKLVHALLDKKDEIEEA